MKPAKSTFLPLFEKLDKKLLRYLTVKVKKFDLEINYFSLKKEDNENKRENKN